MNRDTAHYTLAILGVLGYAMAIYVIAIATGR